MAGRGWADGLGRHRAPAHLEARARSARCAVAAAGAALRVTPDSAGRPCSLVRGDFERTVPLLGRASRDEAVEASRSSSYVEAVLDDLGAP